MNSDGESKESSAHAVASTNIQSVDCPVQTVTVFRDRAEVVRRVPFCVDRIGEHEVRILSLTESLNPESIRVNGLSSCQILEVSHELTTVQDDEIANEAIKECKKKITTLENRQTLFIQQKKRLEGQQKHVQKYTENILYGPSPAGKGDSAVGSGRLPISEASEILEFNMTQMSLFDEQINKIDEEHRKVDDEIKIVRSEMNKLSSSRIGRSSNRSYTVSVLVDTMADSGLVELLLTYVVSDSTWTPSYDVRVSVADSTMQVSYFAEVVQASGEDWKDCHMFLSTSNPSVGSAPPPLPARTVDWGYNIQRRRGQTNALHSKKMKKNASLPPSDRRDCDYDQRHGSFSLLDDHRNMAMMSDHIPMQVAMMNESLPDIRGGGGTEHTALLSSISGSGEAGATTFTIHRMVNIVSDSKPHKVTVTTSTFVPQMVHYVAPNVDASAYLQAKVQNTSMFPLLPSQKVSIFMDGNFISTSAIKQVNPGETFNLFLGVDPALRVEYLPCRTNCMTKGWLGSTECKQYEYCTILHNSKQTACRVIVAEVLPRSADEKIQVELVQPLSAALVRPADASVNVSTDQDILSGLEQFSPQQLSAGTAVATAGGGEAGRAMCNWPNDFVTQNKATNNIVWLRTIPAGDKAEFRFVYRVLWPKGESVDIL